MSDYFPDQPYIVIDQNKCRDKVEVERLFSRCRIENLQLLLPDIAIYEFSKGINPYLTWRKSLEHLCTQPHLVVAGRSIDNMMNQEKRTGELTRDIVYHEVTPSLQQSLAELKTGEETRMNSALAVVAKIIDPERTLREQHASNKKVVTSIRDHWRKSIDESTLGKLRNQEHGVFAGILAELETASIVYHAAINDGCDNSTAVSITSGPSIYSHVVYALAALALDWLAQGGIESLEPEKITNDFHDLDYVVTATYCRSLETSDKRANRIYSGLRDGLERRLMLVRELPRVKREGESGHHTI